jgi:biotin transport system substrate-specific component
VLWAYSKISTYVRYRFKDTKINAMAYSTGTLLTTVSSRTDMSGAIRAAAVLFVTVLTAVAAQVSFPLPFTPVPFTLQPMIVLVGGAALGARLGFTSQALYLLAGIAGLPVFAASATLPQGFLRLLGPTGGFLLAYPFAAFVAGYLAERGFDRRYLTSVVAMAAGLTVVFAFGVAWFAFFAAPTPVGLSRALELGLYPFVGVDIVKILLAAAVLPSVWMLTRR